MTRASVRVVLLASTLAASSAGAQPDIQPIHSFADVPALPRTSAETRPRYGQLNDGMGKTSNGDIKTQPLLTRVSQWMKAITQQTMAQMGTPGTAPSMAGMNSPGAGQTMGQLSQALPRLNGGFQQAMVSYGQASTSLGAKYDSTTNAVTGDFYRRLEKAGCLDPGPHGDCDAIHRAQDQAYLKAGDDYLAALATPYGDLKTKMTAVAADAQSQIDGANKTFGGSVPPMVASMMGPLRNLGVAALTMTMSSESDAVAKVYEKSVAPTLHK